jgi:glycosyltransferase involved in cell wall biosynthesis
VSAKAMKRKVGIFLDVNPAQGGAYQFNLAMAEAVASLPEDRYRAVSAFTNREWEPHLKELEIPGLFIPLGLWGPFACRRMSGVLPTSLWRYLSPFFHRPTQKILEQQCDLWIFPTQDTWTYLFPVKAIGTVYDLMHRYERRFPEVADWGKYGSRERHYKKMCKWAYGILVDSKIGKQHVMESYGLDSNHIHILPFVAPKYISCTEANQDFEKRYDLPEKYLFYPAQFWEHKNHNNLLFAIKDLADRYPDMRLVLSGAPKNGYASIRKMVNSLQLEGRIHFLGYIPDKDISGIYRRACALIMPSYFGPTNIPPLEAAVLGCPMAISDVYGVRDQMGEAALYFHPDSALEISQCIERLWTNDDLRKELAKKGIALSEKWNQAQYNQCFFQIVEKAFSEM